MVIALDQAGEGQEGGGLGVGQAAECDAKSRLDK